MSRTLAMDCSFLGKYGDLPSVFGFDVAVSGLLDALFRFGTHDRFVLFHQPGEPPPAIATALLGRDVDIQVEPTPNIPAVIQRSGPLTWFQPDTQTEPVRYRNALASGVFPFSTVIHNACAPQLMRTDYLSLMLDGFAPCDSFICTSRAVRDAVGRTLEYVASEMNRCTGARLQYRGRLDVLPLGVDTDRFRPGCRMEARRQLGWPEDAVVILWFGRFSAFDKADLLPTLRVFRRLVHANPDKRLLFVLAGSDHKYVPFVSAIRAFAVSLGIDEYVRIVANAPQQGRHMFFVAADVFTSPSDNHQETFGITPIEAMASGTAQVVSDWDGYKDTVEDGVTGFRVPTYWIACDRDAQMDYAIGGRGYQGFLLAQSVAVDLHEYEAALQRLVDDPALRASMGVASRKRAVDVFSWKAVLRRYEDLWDELSAIARSLDPARLPQPPFVRSRVCDRFSSFPTVMLDGTEALTISEDGRRLLAGLDPFPCHTAREHALFSADALIAALEAVRVTPGTFLEISRHVGDTDPGRQSVFLRALMWGLKHGLLECATARRRAAHDVPSVRDVTMGAT